MFFVSEIYTDPPSEFKTPLHKKVYEILSELQIPFERVENDPAVTMEDCVLISEKLNTPIVKTLFLCNRQKTSFYLFVTTADKSFSTKAFSGALNISRVSFASEELLLERVGVEVGATTIFGAVLDTDDDILVVLDKDILKEEYFGCSDGTTTGYMKFKMDDLLNKVIPYTKHRHVTIEQGVPAPASRTDKA